MTQIGEAGVVEAARRAFGGAVSLGRGWHVMHGVGDDTAVLRGPGGRLLLFASDMIVEGVHFDLSSVSARAVGWKALASNVSDVAAMGGRPVAAVVSSGLPGTTPVKVVTDIMRGLSSCARRCGLAVVGGDTVRAPRLVIDVAILGSVERRHLVLRRGARPGDALCVTGALGASYRSGRHARFMPRLEESQRLLRRVRPHAMMDLSDGLAAGAWELARQSRVAIELDAASVPRARGASLKEALYDGEDFELLFAVSASDAGRLPRRLGRCPVTQVGRVLAGRPAVWLRLNAGGRQPVAREGFRHF